MLLFYVLFFISGVKGKCIFEIINNKKEKEVVVLEAGSFLVINKGTSHSVKNDEDNECEVISTLISSSMSEEIAKKYGYVPDKSTVNTNLRRHI
jgi:quercetin dioxygenase-like cupin family protein